MNEIEKLVALLSSVKTWDQEAIEQYVSLASVLIPKGDSFWGQTSPLLNQYTKMIKSDLKVFGRTGKRVSDLLDMMKVFKKLFGKVALSSIRNPLIEAAQAALFFHERETVFSMYKSKQNDIEAYLNRKYGAVSLRVSFDSQIELLVMDVLLKRAGTIVRDFIDAS